MKFKIANDKIMERKRRKKAAELESRQLRLDSKFYQADERKAFKQKEREIDQKKPQKSQFLEVKRIWMRQIQLPNVI